MLRHNTACSKLNKLTPLKSVSSGYEVYTGSPRKVSGTLPLARASYAPGPRSLYETSVEGTMCR